MSYGYPRDRYPTVPARSSWLLAVLSILNLLAVLAVGAALQYWSEDWWLSTILVYAPKAPLAVPAGLLLLISLAVRPRWLIVNLASLLLVLGPIMGFVAPVAQWTQAQPAPQEDDLRVVSCNIQAFRPDFSTVVAELSNFRPELVAFQEVRGDDHPLLAKYFEGWHVARNDGYWVGSKFPLRLIQPIQAPTFDRIAGVLVEVELPSGPILVANVHLMTARRSLGELSLRGVVAGEGRDLVSAHQALREAEMMEVRAQIDDTRGGRPLIALGDFNTPASSSLFQRWWSDLPSAYDAAGLGWGYTSPCKKNHHYWFPDTPWVRIDHILASYEWTVVRSAVGVKDGSDHRLISATLRLKEFLTPTGSSRPETRGEGFSEGAESTEDSEADEETGGRAGRKFGP